MNVDFLTFRVWTFADTVTSDDNDDDDNEEEMDEEDNDYANDGKHGTGKTLLHKLNVWTETAWQISFETMNYGHFVLKIEFCLSRC